ncbi:MAG: AIR carboxylase family protein, partial [Pseudomonadales bacterium]|nr:AIR carboxylase family protein [Pseudomonadales bacterium]
IPVATVAIGKAGAKNAAHLASQILALADPALAQRCVDGRQENRESVIAKNAKLQETLNA